MNLKELIKEVESLKKKYKCNCGCGICNLKREKLDSIKQTVEATDEMLDRFFNINPQFKITEFFEDWQKLKKLLGVGCE